MLKICITGHRDLLNEKIVKKDIRYSLKFFKKMDNDLVAISAVAKGADMFFAEEAIDQKIPLHIILPFDLEEYKKDFTAIDLKKLEIVLGQKEFEIATKSPINNDDERNNAYFEVGRKMVDESDIVLAVWDGKDTGGKGGTSDIVKYARSKNKPLHIIKGIRPSQDGETVVLDEAQTKFDELDGEAIKYKKRRFAIAWITGIVTGLAAVFCFAIGLSFPLNHNGKFIFSAAEMFFLIVSFISLAVFARKWKNIFLERRRDAEYLRTVLWYKEAGIPIPKIEKTDYSPGKRILDIETNTRESLPTIKDIPNAQRIAWCLAEEQTDYHQKTRIDPFESNHKTTEHWLTGIKIVFFIAAPVNFTLECLEHFKIVEWDQNIFKPYLLFLSLILPPLYAALEGIRYFGEWKRNITVSQKIVADLTIIKEAILSSKDEKSLLPQTKMLRNALEFENNDWAIRYKEKEVGPKL